MRRDGIRIRRSTACPSPPAWQCEDNEGLRDDELLDNEEEDTPMETSEAMQRQARVPAMGDRIRNIETRKEGVVLEVRAGESILAYVVRWARGDQEIACRHAFEFIEEAESE